ncbi:ATP-binding cassette domain-containing protein [Paenibacillus illinoisensis]|uniref:ATP-binding cassette domain-containing protein n=1 Tax=Paenibacillus illinoisensis TaxID=59845 RepID=A0ABW8HRL2_9BACL
MKIEVNQLSKHYQVQRNKKEPLWKLLSRRGYETKRVVDNISFNVEEGEIVGYLGPNGAGKSTTIKMLTGILVPSEGEILVNGIVPHKNRKEHSKQIGVVFGQRSQLWWELPVADSFNLLKHMYKVSDIQFKKKLDLFHDVLDIGSFINTPVRNLSLGQKMRADFAASLLHDPQILFLDEPTIGLDVVAKERIREFIQTINRENKVTVILTTHDVGDIEALCHRTIIIDKGKIIYNGDLDNMKSQFGKYRTLIVDIKTEKPVYVENATIVKVEGSKVWIQFNRNVTNPTQIISSLIKTYEVEDFTVEEPQIENIIKHIYDGKHSTLSNNERVDLDYGIN